MSFSSPRYRWLKVTAIILGLAQLTGCAGFTSFSSSSKDDRDAAELAELFDDSDRAEDEAPVEDDSAAILESVIEEVPESEEEAMLPLPVLDAPLTVYDWEVISGGMVGNKLSGITDSTFKRPVAVAARSEYVYVVDEGLDAVLRYDQATGRITEILDLKSAVTGEVADIYVDKDFSFYITDTDGGRVLLYDRHGRLVRVFKDRFNLTKPVSVNVLDGGDVVVADGHFDHILRFTNAGKLIAAYGGRGSDVAQFTNITAMALGPDGFYVGARVGRKVQVLSMDGHYAYSFGEGQVIFPAAIVVDSGNKSYVADHMDHQIKVFDRGRLIATIGRAGSAPGQFMRVTDMWLDDTFLYIVDSLNARIQVARLAPAGAPNDINFTPLFP
ncbi:NHL repeat-containing protein [Pseudomonadota bacterium]